MDLIIHRHRPRSAPGCTWCAGLCHGFSIATPTPKDTRAYLRVHRPHTPLGAPLFAGRELFHPGLRLCVSKARSSWPSPRSVPTLTSTRRRALIVLHSNLTNGDGGANILLRWPQPVSFAWPKVPESQRVHRSIV